MTSSAFFFLTGLAAFPLAAGWRLPGGDRFPGVLFPAIERSSDRFEGSARHTIDIDNQVRFRLQGSQKKPKDGGRIRISFRVGIVHADWTNVIDKKPAMSIAFMCFLTHTDACKERGRDGPAALTQPSCEVYDAFAGFPLRVPGMVVFRRGSPLDDLGKFTHTGRMKMSIFNHSLWIRKFIQ
jgi:hypothetical protein